MAEAYTSGITGIIPVIAASCALYIVFLMTIMSVTMYRRQLKNNAYLFMIAAFLFIMTYEGLNIYFSLSPKHAEGDYPLSQTALQVLSFILLNTAVYQLYHRMNQTANTLFGIMLAVLLIPLIPDSLFRVKGHSEWRFIYLDLYQLVVIYLSVVLIAPRIKQKTKLFAGLSIYFLMLILGLMKRYVIPDEPLLMITIQLLPLVYYTLIFLILFERIVELMQNIYRSSITDGLTSLYNRRFFLKSLTNYINEGLKVSLIFCDIDNFKKLNDTEGHAKADQVLKQVAMIIDEELAGIGVAGRYGGEELVALVVDKRASVSQVAEQIRSRVEKETIVTISVGYSVLKKNVSTEQFIKQADEAMYRSKTTGKNKVTAFRQSPSRAAAIEEG
ncbi:GGDEF domain-containing protein [Paenibacillus sediminis]|uniref:Diguanylate cyclase (GGDEF)-like protein n=1 Tax=Paenibacillus sediminis TaxID=664909 RepID=A0ABS4H6N4_9BACL|nr:GGDEF domain-containing protein [Paenibacillus sediminis]MBP1937720.1 diguanylate cyclase (GGDEF)-like protein [Paenibacillus sediminis]